MSSGTPPSPAHRLALGPDIPQPQLQCLGQYLIFHQPSRFFWITTTTAPLSRFISSWSLAV